jgi:hypothetical protein
MWAWVPLKLPDADKRSRCCDVDDEADGASVGAPGTSGPGPRSDVDDTAGRRKSPLTLGDAVSVPGAAKGMYASEGRTTRPPVPSKGCPAATAAPAAVAAEGEYARTVPVTSAGSNTPYTPASVESG